MVATTFDSRANEGSSSSKGTAGRLLQLVMVFVVLSFGAYKFTAHEARGGAPLVSNSPLTSWLNASGTQGASTVVGVAELTFVLLLAIGFWRPESRLLPHPGRRLRSRVHDGPEVHRRFQEPVRDGRFSCVRGAELAPPRACDAHDPA